ncbi:MAG: NAD(P)-dependent oxidoreductase [Thermoplasmata archaeon]
MEDPRLLVTIPPSTEVDQVLACRLPGVPVLFARDFGSTARASIEAALIGQLDRQLPQLTPDLLPNLRFAQSLSTGVDRFPFSKFGAKVRIAGNVGAYAPSVAEHAVALILALAKNIVTSDRIVHDGRLRPVPNSLVLEGRRALIVGFGAIGHEVARRLRGMGLTIEGISRDGASDPGADHVAPLVELGDAMERADVIVNCLPLARDTLGVFGKAELARLRPEAMFVNVGRARTIDATAFWSFLEEHPNTRVGLDVWWDEDFASGRLKFPAPLERYPHLIGSPHSAGATSASRGRAFELACQNLARFFGGEDPLYVVDRRNAELEDPSP